MHNTYQESGPRAEEREIPSVSIELTPSKLGMRGTHEFEQFVTGYDDFAIKNNEGVTVGIGVLARATLEDGKKVAWVNVIRIPQSGEGFGKAAYKELISQLGDTKLVSSPSLSIGAYKVWEWLTDQHLAKKTELGEIAGLDENANYGSAKYESI